MNPLVLMCIAALTLVASLVFAFLHFRADARRGREAERACFQHHATVRGPTIAKLERDRRLPFAGRVQQQIRTFDPRVKQRLRIIRDEN